MLIMVLQAQNSLRVSRQLSGTGQTCEEDVCRCPELPDTGKEGQGFQATGY